MRQFVESLKRLYKDGQISRSVIDDLFKNNKITLEEKRYIFNIE